MINFNDSPEQSSGFGIIPPDSIVYVRLHIKTPDAGRVGVFPELTQSLKSAMQYLNTELEVVTGAFQGKKLYKMFFYNTHGLNDGQQKATNSSMAMLRALVEVKNQISPKDESERAKALRQLNSFSELEGAVFPIMVKCERVDGENGSFMANAVKKIVTVDDSNYAIVNQSGELITENPIPTVESSNNNAPVNRPPAANAAPQPPNAPTSNAPFSQPAHGSEQSQNSFTPPPVMNSAPTGSPAPGWATNAPNNGLDDMPF